LFSQNKSCLVIGGGIAGIASALKVANGGLEVYLLEKEAVVEGQAASYCCKAVEVCTKCSVCLVPRKLNEVLSHPRISILTDSTVMGITGGIGNFQAEVLQKPQYISSRRCIACGLCAEVCPVEPKAIYPPSPEAVPYSYIINESQCLRLKGEECNLCQGACPTDAISFELASFW
jgi:heterodisulfide reductase subunit A